MIPCFSAKSFIPNVWPSNFGSERDRLLALCRIGSCGSCNLTGAGLFVTWELTGNPWLSVFPYFVPLSLRLAPYFPLRRLSYTSLYLHVLPFHRRVFAFTINIYVQLINGITVYFIFSDTSFG